MPESRTRIIIGHPATEADHHRRWADHVAAGRIGTTPPVDPEIAKNRDRWTALFQSKATLR